MLVMLITGGLRWTCGTGRSQLVKLMDGAPVEIHYATWRTRRGAVPLTSPQTRADLAAALRSARRNAAPAGPTTIVGCLTLACSFGFGRTIDLSADVADDGSVMIHVPHGTLKGLLTPYSDLEMYGISAVAAKPILGRIAGILPPP